jgi:hypothetical protein
MASFSNVPDNYIPEVILSENEYNDIYNGNLNLRLPAEQRLHVRDYAIIQYRYAIGLAVANRRCVDEQLAELPSEKLKALFWGVDPCTCCWRHRHNMPVAIDSLDDSTVLDRITEQQLLDCGDSCKCYCRAAKRAIRRAYFRKASN